MKKALLIILPAMALLSACRKDSDIIATAPVNPNLAINNTNQLSGSLAPTIQWQKTYGSGGSDIATSIKPTSDGGYIVAGYSDTKNGNVTVNHGKNDYWIVKLSSTGDIQWQKSFGGTDNEYATSVEQTTDGGYVVAGMAESTNGNVGRNISGIQGSYWVIRLNTAGGIIWQKCYAFNTIGSSATSIRQTSDGGFIVAGNGNYLQPTLSYGDGLVIKIDADGNIQWHKVLGGGYHDEINSIQQTTDGDYIAAGATASSDGVFAKNHSVGAFYDYYIVKLSSDGKIVWQKIYGSKDDDHANAVQQTADGGYIVAGYAGATSGNVTSNHGGTDYWIVKLNSDGAIQWQKSYGGPGGEYASSIQQTTDGGYIIAGTLHGGPGGMVTYNHNPGTSDIWVIKIDGSGTLLWQKSFGGGSWEDAYEVRQTSDGGYIVAGDSFSNDGDVTHNRGYYDFWVFKLK